MNVADAEDEAPRPPLQVLKAFFGRNDFFPFTKDELAKHDPEMFALLEKLWNPAK